MDNTLKVHLIIHKKTKGEILKQYFFLVSCEYEVILPGNLKILFCNVSLLYSPTEAQTKLITRITPTETHGQFCKCFVKYIILIDQVKLFVGTRNHSFESTYEVKLKDI